MNTSLYIAHYTNFYSLLEVTTTDEKHNGYTIVYTTTKFIKNISKDKDVALAKYPTAILKEDATRDILRTTRKYVYDADIFAFGKYKLTSIKACKDYDYLKWYYKTDITLDTKRIIKNVLLNAGYKFFCGTFISNDDIRKANIYNREKAYARADFSGDAVTVKFTKNLNRAGNYNMGYGITIHFPNIKEYWYGDFNYFLPVDSKNNAKRLKNKNIMITNYTTEYNEDEESMVVNVIDFKIVK